MMNLAHSGYALQLFLKCHREIYSEITQKLLEGFAMKFVPHVWVHFRMYRYDSGDPLTFLPASVTAVAETDPLNDCRLSDFHYNPHWPLFCKECAQYVVTDSFSCSSLVCLERL